MIWTAHQRLLNMTEQKDESPKTELDELLKAYALAVVEFNLASAPLIVALTAGVRPSAADIKREENARAAVVEARQKVWAYQAEGRRRKEIRRRGRLPSGKTTARRPTR